MEVLDGKVDYNDVESAMYNHFAEGRARIYKRNTPYVTAVRWTGKNALNIVDLVEGEFESHVGGILNFKVGKRSMMVYVGDWVILSGNDVFTMNHDEFVRHFNRRI